MPLGSVIYFLFQLTSRFHSIFCTHLLLYFKGISKKLNYALISNISTYFIHSNLPYVLFIWQSNNLYQKQLYFQRNFLENLPQIHKIYFTLLRQSFFSSLKSTHSRQIWSSIDKVSLRISQVKETNVGIKKFEKNSKKMPLGSVIYFLFQLTSRFHSIFCTHLLLYFKGISKKLNYALISNISTYFIHSNLPYVLFIWQSNNLYQKQLYFQRNFLENLPQIHKIYFTLLRQSFFSSLKSTHSRQIWSSIDKDILG